MQQGQQLNNPKFSCRATLRQRIISAAVLLCLACFFGILGMASAGRIDLGRYLDPCGFKQRHHLPCPTCGMTTSALAFARGHFLESFYVQPVGALFCSILVFAAFLALLITVFGVYFHFLERFFTEVKIKYIILALIIIIAAGWAVTLARAMAEKSQG